MFFFLYNYFIGIEYLIILSIIDLCQKNWLFTFSVILFFFFYSWGSNLTSYLKKLSSVLFKLPTYWYIFGLEWKVSTKHIFHLMWWGNCYINFLFEKVTCLSKLLEILKKNLKNIFNEIILLISQFFLLKIWTLGH